MSREDRAAAIILAYACANATAGGLLANTVVGDAIVLAPLIFRMTDKLARLCDKNLESGAAAALASQLFGAAAGGYLAGKLVSWIPFVGNQINAKAVFETTQVMGWAAFGLFDAEMTQTEAICFGESRKMTKEEMDAIICRMPSTDRARYGGLKRTIGNLAASKDEKSSAAREMAQLIIKHKRAPSEARTPSQPSAVPDRA